MPLNLAPHSRFARRWLFDRNRIGGRKSVLKGLIERLFPAVAFSHLACASARKLFWFPDWAAQDFKSAAAQPKRCSRVPADRTANCRKADCVKAQPSSFVMLADTA